MVQVRILGVVVCICCLIAGCSTNDKADEFLKQTQTTTPISKNIPTDTGSVSPSSQLFDEISNGTISATNISSSPYQDYSQTGLNDARTAGKRIVLIAHSEQCSSCVSLRSSIGRSLSRIPDDVVILSIDYDKDTTIAKQYAITKPNTIIVLQADGTERKRASDGIYNMDKLLYYL